MTFAALASKSKTRIQVDPATGDGYVPIAQVCGPVWWANLHSWAENLRDYGCQGCGTFAVAAMSAVHDVVNIKLGKPVHDPESFRLFQEAMHEMAHQAQLCNVCDSEAAQAQEDYLVEVHRPVTRKRLLTVPSWFDGEHRIEFVPKENVPGFSHRVIIDGKPMDWLGDHVRPSGKVARYYLDKHFPEVVQAQGIGSTILDGFARGFGVGLGSLAVERLVRDQLAGVAAQGKPHLTSDALKLDVSGSGSFVRERVASPNAFDRRSFRTIKTGSHRRVVACPSGEYDVSAERCDVGLQVQSILHPRKEKAKLVREAKRNGVQVITEAAQSAESWEEEVQEIIDDVLTSGAVR